MSTISSWKKFLKHLLYASVIVSLVGANCTTFAFTIAEKEQKLSMIKQLKSNDETVFAIVPKNIEPFFDVAAQGCIDTAKEIGIHCIYYGSKVENMRDQVADILSLIEAGVDGIAVSAIRKGFIADTIGDELKDWGGKIISFDSPLSSEISQAYVGSDNYLLGRTLGAEIRKLRSKGGNYCIQTERPDSPNHIDRLKGIIDGMTKDGAEADKWKQVSGCPLTHMGDIERATKQMIRMINTYQVEMFIGTGGGSQFSPGHYRKAMEPFKEKIQTGKLLIANNDTISARLEYLKEGISTVNVGQRPYEMGKWTVKILKLISDGECPPVMVITGLTNCNRENWDTCAEIK
jgi:ribose transport system substrate-binding protein